MSKILYLNPSNAVCARSSIVPRASPTRNNILSGPSSSSIPCVNDGQRWIHRLQQQQRHLGSRSSSAGIMSGLTPVFTKDACPPAGPYSQAIKAAGQVFVAGQIPADTQGNLVTGSIASKTEQCIKNLKAILEEAGSGIPKVVKVGVFLSDMQHFAEMNGEYEKWFTHRPARTCVAVKQLPKGVDVEIEAIAIQ